MIDERKEVDKEGGDSGADLRASVENSERRVPDGRREDFFGEEADPEKVDTGTKLF